MMGKAKNVKQKSRLNISARAAFVLGLLVGGLVDWIYWKRNQAGLENELSLAKNKLSTAEMSRAELERQLAALKVDPKTAASKADPLEHVEVVEPPVQAADDLKVIKGIGPVISKKLNQAGIYTFRELGNMTPDRLREIVGDVIQRLANEDSLIQQAKILADKKDQGD